jgi:single-strand DNA-binding protein
MINSIVLVGRLTRDPEARKTNNGTSVASFRIASDDSFKAGEKTTLFMDVTVFGKSADTVAKYMRKGNLVGVTGRLSQRKYMSTKTNTEVTVTEIIANSVEFVGPKSASSDEDTGYRPDAPSSVSNVPGTSSKSSESQNLDGIDILDDALPF